MTSDLAAKRFAENLLKENGHNGRFEVRLDDTVELDRVASALASLGCVVAKNSYRNMLDVTCPQG